MLRDTIKQNQDRWLKQLTEFLAIPSISTLPDHSADCLKAADWLMVELRRLGCPKVELLEGRGHPTVWAESPKVAGAPTVLIYGHYDVQPVEPLEEWTTPPFQPTVRNGNLYARGAVDDKGQMYMHVKAIEALFAAHGKLPVNVKFLIEGEEEIGGKSIAKFVAENQTRLKADVALVSDTALYAEGMPTLCIGLRGLIYMEVEA